MASSGGLTTAQASPLFVAAWRRKFGRDPSDAELQSLLCVSKFDGSFGAWPEDSAMWGSRNLGAIQCRHNGDDCSTANPGDTCAPLLTWELVDGERVDQTECFRTYATWDAAADDFINEMTAPKRPATGAALRSGSLRTLTTAMRSEHYFTADPEKYAQALAGMETSIVRDLGLPGPAVTLDGSNLKRSLLIVGAALAIAYGLGWL